MKKILVLMLALVLVLGTFAACGGTPATSDDPATSTEPVTSSDPSNGDAKVVKMGLAMNSKQAAAFHAWAEYLYERVTFEADERGYTVEWTELNADNDVTKQANDIKDLLAKGCEVIFCPALDSKAILQSVEEVHKAGALFISYCREVSPDATGDQIPDATINFSSEEQAYVGVMKMFEIMKKDGIEPTSMIDVYGDVTDENAVNRETGMRRALVDSGYADLKVTIVDCGRWEPDVALANMEPALQADPDANCLYTSSDFLMPGIQTALENAGKWAPRGEEGHVYIAASDMFPIGIELLRSGYIDTGVDQGCYMFAVGAAKSAFDLLEGKPVEKVQLTLGTQATNEDIEEIIATIPLWGIDYE